MRKSGLVYRVKRHFLSGSLDKRQRNRRNRKMKKEGRKERKKEKKKKKRKERRDFLASRVYLKALRC